jgi:ADP-ribose diphosphatase
MSEKKPKILATRSIATGRLFEIEEVHLQFSNGAERVFERIKGRLPGAVMIAPLLDKDTILLIREYGVGAEDYVLTLPKGIMEEGEDIFKAANRELQEEIGYGAKQFSLLKPLTTAPGYIKGKGMKLVLAEDLYPQKLTGDEPEEIEVVPWKLSNLQELLAREDFTEARSVAALYMIRDRIQSREK